LDEVPAELAGYPVVIDWPVQWGDQDAFGHVNNTVYFRWFETARIAYLDRLGMAERGSGETLGPILAAIDCNYRRQIKYPDQVAIGTRVVRVGRSSMLLEQIIWSQAQQAVAADGQSTVVAFDYALNKPRPVPDKIRAEIAAIEGKPV